MANKCPAVSRSVGETGPGRRADPRAPRLAGWRAASGSRVAGETPRPPAPTAERRRQPGALLRLTLHRAAAMRGGRSRALSCHERRPVPRALLRLTLRRAAAMRGGRSRAVSGGAFRRFRQSLLQRLSCITQIRAHGQLSAMKRRCVSWRHVCRGGAFSVALLGALSREAGPHLLHPNTPPVPAYAAQIFQDQTFLRLNTGMESNHRGAPQPRKLSTCVSLRNPRGVKYSICWIGGGYNRSVEILGPDGLFARVW